MEDISPKSRLATALLAWFFGQFGAHRFYIGRYRTAIALLILSIFGWSTAWNLGFGLIAFIPVGALVFIDLVMTLLGIMKDSQGRPIKNW